MPSLNKDDSPASSREPVRPATTDAATRSAATTPKGPSENSDLPKEVGGQKGPEPTRYGDWEKNGRCTDF